MWLGEMRGDGWDVDKFTLTPILQGYCNAGKFKEALIVFNRIFDRGWVDEHVFTILMVSFSKWGEVDKAFELVEKMEGLNMNPNEKTLCSLIHGFAKESRVDKALQLFEKMQILAFNPDLPLYSVLIEGLCKKKELDKALQLYTQMKSTGIYPDVHVYRILISSFCLVGHFVTVNNLLEEGVEGLDVGAIVLLYNAVLDGLVSCGLAYKAYLLIRAMMGTECVDEAVMFKGKVSPNNASFFIVIDGLCKTEKLDEALILYRGMIQMGCERNVLLYNNVIEALCNSDRLEESFEILGEMKESGLRPTEFTHNCIFGCLCRRESVMALLDLMKEMRVCGHEPWIKHSSGLIKQLCSRGDAIKACDFLADMAREGFLPDIIAYSAAIDGKSDMGHIYFKEMKEIEMRPDPYVYVALISGSISNGNLLLALEIMKEMVQNKQFPVPSDNNYCLMIDAVSKLSENPTTSLDMKNLTLGGGIPAICSVSKQGGIDGLDPNGFLGPLVWSDPTIHRHGIATRACRCGTQSAYSEFKLCSEDFHLKGKGQALLQSLLSSSSILFTSPNPKNYTKSLHLSQSSSSSSSSSSSVTPTPIISHSPKHIFLPLLQQEEEKTSTRRYKDPILKFFISRSSDHTQDPSYEGRTLLQKNRRSLWRLADMGPGETDIIEDEELHEEEVVDEGDLSSSPVEGVLAEIIQLARNVPEDSTLGELLVPFEGKLGENECVKMLSLLVDEGLVVGCLYFFEWMGLQEPSLVSPKACSVMFTLGKAGFGEKLMVLYRNLPTTMRFRDVRLYNAAISGLSCCGRFDDAWEVFEAMDRMNIQPDHVTCSILITVMRRSGRSAKDVWEFFEKMNSNGVKWSLEVMGALIKSFCDEGLKDEALVIQSEMEKRGVSSNVIIYNTLMDAYSKDNQIEEAEGLFLEMKEKGLKPTSASYNILMDAYSRRMQPEIIEDLLREMQDAGLEPNVKSYTCLISAYGRQKRMSDKAADAFLRMKKLGIKPTSHSYTALIHAYSVNGWHEKAYITFENMEREGIKPSVETYTALLDAFRRAGDTRTLMGIWKLMTEDKIKGTHVTFNTLLDGFAKQGQYSEARDVVSEFGRIGLQPTVMTYNMLMNAYARGGQHSKLPLLLKEMAVLNLKPDSITYSTMIYAYVRVRDFSKAFYYHKQMVKSKQVPDAKSYQKLRAILDVKAALKNRKDKSALLGIINSSMGMLKEKRKGKKDEFWKNRKKRPASTYSSGPRR
ncbi:hypothetical protein IFM89_007716 [Coptis chinensis]|uniref:Pentatricopeptide repeat-containing protein n=1 Tax=Coptis chinensis TaxID=261450 RepID=A0A835IVK5_9MAGN|nr:hypothetical protein IFM89_007716 [Coptis chinensis]